jgi:tetraacyldisaccharide 4'-kinase
LLLPFSALYSIVIAIRRFLYVNKIIRTHRVAAPVVVVGNISVGGTGKTPLTIWLAKALRDRGRKPGIVSRGYRGNVGRIPVVATADSDPEVVGDEAILIATQTACPVVVHPDRVAAAARAIELGADVVISDDGLQHYRLSRNFEIAVVDGVRGFGNGQSLPAGPLREPLSRLDEVDSVLVHRQPGDDPEVLRRATDQRPQVFRLRVSTVARVDQSETRSIDEFAGKTVHAVAGIGNPERFFSMLESHSIRVYRHPLPDHADIGPADIAFDDDLDVLLTEKDAVKCRWLDTRKCWYVAVSVNFDGTDESTLLGRITVAIEEADRTS